MPEIIAFLSYHVTDKSVRALVCGNGVTNKSIFGVELVRNTILKVEF